MSESVFLPGTKHLIFRAPGPSEHVNYWCTHHEQWVVPIQISEGAGDVENACESCMLEELAAVVPEGEATLVVGKHSPVVEIMCKASKCESVAEEECPKCGQEMCSEHMDPGGRFCTECQQLDKDFGDEDDPQTPDFLKMKDDMRVILEES